MLGPFDSNAKLSQGIKAVMRVDRFNRVQAPDKAVQQVDAMTIRAGAMAIGN